MIAMSNGRRALAMALAAGLVMGVSAAGAQEPGFQRAKEFWNALSAANTEAMKGFYAKQVVLKAGSELLKKEWNLSPTVDRNKDLVVDRATLMAGYEKMIARFGKDAWSQVFVRLPAESVQVTIANKPGQPFPPVQPGDVLMKVSVGRKADTLVFVFRREGDAIAIVAERTDY